MIRAGGLPGQGLPKVAGYGAGRVLGDDTGSRSVMFTASMPGWPRDGVPVVREPAVEPWGLIEIHIEDPDGVRIVLAEVPAGHPCPP